MERGPRVKGTVQRISNAYIIYVLKLYIFKGIQFVKKMGATPWEKIKQWLFILVTITWIQIGISELLENKKFVDSHCSPDQQTDRFIRAYCSVHETYSDFTSIRILLHSFCLSGIWPMVLSTCIVAFLGFHPLTSTIF